MNYNWNWRIFWEVSADGKNTWFMTLIHGLGWTLATALSACAALGLRASYVGTISSDDNGAFRLDMIEPDPLPPAPTPTPIQKLFLSSKSFRFVTVPASEKITFDGNGRRTLPAPDADASIVIEGPIGGLNVNRITIDTGVGGRVKVITPVEWK